MKKLVRLFLVLVLTGGVLWFGWSIYWQETVALEDQGASQEYETGEEYVEEMTQDEECIEGRYSIQGQTDIKPGLHKYSIERHDFATGNNIQSIQYFLKKWDDIIDQKGVQTYSYEFTTPWTKTLEVLIKEKWGCEYELSKEINIYDQVFVYVGRFESYFDSDIFFRQFQQDNILFQNIVFDSEWMVSEENIIQKLSDNRRLLGMVDNIIINADNFASIFESVSRVDNLYDIGLNYKDIVLVTDVQKNFLQNFLAKYLNIVDLQKIYILPEDKVITLLEDIWETQGFVSNEKGYLDVLSVSIQDTPRLYFLSYMVDYLIYQWLPINLLGLMMSVVVGVIVISFFRQVIGFSVFGVFSPILFALAMVVFGMQLGLALLFVSFLATGVVKIITSKMYLLYSAKVALLITVYILLIVAFLWVDDFYGLGIVDLEMFLNSYILFPMFFVVIAWNKVFRKKKNFLKIGWWIYFAEFLIISFSVYLILGSNNLQYYLISYPEILIGLFVLNVIVGRFTWLQVLEYLRFMPLLKRRFQDEEEE